MASMPAPPARPRDLDALWEDDERPLLSFPARPSHPETEFVVAWLVGGCAWRRSITRAWSEKPDDLHRPAS